MSSGRERRHHYRAAQSPSDPIEAAIHLPTGEVLATEFRDLSGSGVSVSVLLECSHLDDGDVIELEVWAPGRHRVRTPANRPSSIGAHPYTCRGRATTWRSRSTSSRRGA